MRSEHTSVLVVGGGLVGLSAALFLAGRGVRTIVLERHAGSSPHPRAIGYTPRTMELYRAAGIAAAIPPAPRSAGVRRVRAESLAGRWFEEQPWTPGAQAPEIEYSPCTGAAIAQDALEPILRSGARERGADIRMNTELLSFEQRGEAVVATVRDQASGQRYQVRADYLVAADGHRSAVRERLGVRRAGRGYLHTGRSVLFRAELDEYLAHGIAQFVIDRPDFSGFLTTYGDGRWVLFHADEDGEQGREWVLRAIGREDVDVEVLTNGRWEVSALIAECYRVGRVFLAGDAAHTLPPNRGGYSANTGIEDAHNLAWKLAAVLAGRSGPALLDTYEAERRPVAWLCHQQIFARNDGHSAPAEREPVDLVDDAAMGFGYLYRSDAVLGAGAELPAAMRPEQWAGQPGTRAPHLPLPGGGSTLDRFGDGWVLVSADGGWAGAARVAAERTGTPVRSERIDAPGFGAAYGLDADGAALVRPDGYLAWRARSRPADMSAELTAALGAVCFA